MSGGVGVPEWPLTRRRGVDGVAVHQPHGSGTAIQIAVPEDHSVLRTMLRISNAVLCADFFDEVLEVVAEQALVALRASAVSVGRWERDTDTLRTLINAGELRPGEQRWPDHDIYPLADDPYVTGLLQRGRPYMHAIDDERLDPAVFEYLRGVGKESEVAVPVMFGDTMWGEIWAAGVAGRRFGHDDVQLLQAIAAYTAVAIGRSELLTTVWQHAHLDPLTDLANRRALEVRFAEIDWQTYLPTLLVGDLDGFKDINDRDGHPAGDSLLRAVAGVLRESAAVVDHAMAARLGGDEFCVLLPQGSLTDAERLAHKISRRLRAAVSADVTMTWGAAESGHGVGSGQALLAAADAALRQAKTLGPGRFSGGVSAPDIVPGSLARRSGTGGRRTIDTLVPRVAALIDTHRPLSALAALEILAVQAQHAIDAAGWAVSVTAENGTNVITWRDIDSVRDPVSGLWVLRPGGDAEPFRLIDYPATARAIATGTSFIAAVDLGTSDPAETALLNRLGYRGVLGVGVRDAEHGYLLEIYSADGHAPLTEIAVMVQVLAHYCLSVASVPSTV
jgi:diguanylate cyclase (GGDEF)-like protein